MNYRRFNNYFLLIISLGLLITGYGITKYQIIGPLTLGLMSKSLAFKLHSWLTPLFIISMGLHVYWVRRKKIKK